MECEKCGGGDIYTTQSGERVCRRCGHRKKLNAVDNNNYKEVKK